MKRVILAVFITVTGLFGNIVNVNNIYPSDNVCILSKSSVTDDKVICLNGIMYRSINAKEFKELKYLDKTPMKCNCIDR